MRSLRFEYFAVFDKEFILSGDIGITASYEYLKAIQTVDKIVLALPVKFTENVVKEDNRGFTF